MENLIVNYLRTGKSLKKRLPVMTDRSRLIDFYEPRILYILHEVYYCVLAVELITKSLILLLYRICYFMSNTLLLWRGSILNFAWLCGIIKEIREVSVTVLLPAIIPYLCYTDTN